VLAGFIGAKDDGSGGDNWSYKSVITIDNQTPNVFTGRMPFLSPNQQCQSTEGKISHFTNLLTASLLGSFNFVFDPTYRACQR